MHIYTYAVVRGNGKESKDFRKADERIPQPPENANIKPVRSDLYKLSRYQVNTNINNYVVIVEPHLGLANCSGMLFTSCPLTLRSNP